MKKIAFSMLATGSLALFLGVSDADASSYTIKPGDSLWKIASSNKVSVADLKKWNALSSDAINANQVLKLSPAATITASSNSPSAQKSQTASSSEYIVKSGDTLSRIATLHKTKVSDIQKLNGLTSHQIFPGQKLKVSGATATSAKPATATPAPAIAQAPAASSASYKVVKGDTLSGIATRHKVSVAQLKSWNSLSLNTIRIGQVLKIHNATAAVKHAPAAPAIPAPAPSIASTGTYKVAKGDTLTGIAIRHGISATQIMNWNSLTSSTIRIGQVLKVQNTVVATQPAPTPVSNPAPAPSGTTGKLISIATSQLGTPYVWGGASVGAFDCSGYIYYVFNQAGIKIPRTNTTGYDARSYDVSNPQVGDLVFFANTYKPGISHMGIYLGNNNFIHAGGDRVQITSLSDKYWGKHFDGFKRFY
ncbi:MAG TPA: LysM peptidoglycan-binding domain-containing protein [Planococcus sp. (in: firmicutes)]|nr:LysM peptidoglycan-binding domain-containing protein [Planococcus sp. (in: firmicutes)]